MSLVLTMGVARFSYTPLIPIMLEQTSLSDFSAGLLATLNYFGYFCGVLIAASISDLMLKDRLYRIGLIIAVVTTLGMAFAENMILWSIMRFLAGFSSAAGLMIGSGLVLNWLMRHHYRSELGVHFMGIGLGIALTAVMVDLMIGYFDWQTQWIIFSFIGLLVAIPAWRWLPRPENGLVTSTGEKLEDKPPSVRFTRLMQSAYFCAGFGYVISATFIVAIVERQPALSGEGELVWLILGLAAIPAVLIWDQVARRVGTLNALLICYSLQIIGIGLPLINESLSVVLISAILYGATFVGIVSLVLTMAGRFYPTKPAKLMAKMTIAYGVAQIAGPFIAGILAEKTGHYRDGLNMAIIIMLIGILILFIVRAVEKNSVAAIDENI